MENKIKQNKISFNGKEMIWDYEICPCLTCSIYPMKKEFEDDPDVKNNKCWTSGCLYDRENARMVANAVYVWTHYYYCDECDEHFNKDELIDKTCPNCYSDLS